MGGQTGLNTAMELAENGCFARYNVQLIGANEQAIKARRRPSRIQEGNASIGMDLPKSSFAYNMDEAWEIAQEIGFPLIIRPSFTLGGTGGGIVYDESDFNRAAQYGLHCSRINEILIEESVIGWKEYELEIMRDRKDNVVIICSIENLDPMGIHTGDSITVAPAQTLSDRQYQIMRDASIAIIREIGVETGGSNIQFAVHPDDRPHGRCRDEPARQPQLGPGEQGDRISHCKICRKTRGRLYARRNPQRYNPRNAGIVRTDHRLLRSQDPAIHLRKISRSGFDPRHPDEIGGRDHGDRPHLQGGAAERVAGARNQAERV